jgi:hypothetical protein
VTDVPDVDRMNRSGDDTAHGFVVSLPVRFEFRLRRIFGDDVVYVGRHKMYLENPAPVEIVRLPPPSV